ncbi:hypothetical protein, partial [Bradyrhizobium sp. AUGA SZCCT0222]|uniref:hypothetical protein n=1 Tax=Bradyrhizobium sp. AUGA SZCCT0222 TaxID=2807668 RepID=UPI001BA7FB34
SRKAIAQGMSDVLRCPVCSCAAFLCTIAHETAGAARIRHSLRPLNFGGAEFLAKLGRDVPREREIAFVVIASAAKQSMPPHEERMDCFASLAMTLVGCLKFKSEQQGKRNDLAQPALVRDGAHSRGRRPA